MEKPKEKLKKILIILGITGAVYAGCKYLLPLVIPFFAAYAMALLLEPSSAWLSRKLSSRWKGRSVRFPIELIGGAELLLILAALSAGIYFGGQRLLEQVWDSSGSYVNDNTLTVAVKRLREKLGHPACFRTVRSFGYRMEM